MKKLTFLLVIIQIIITLTNVNAQSRSNKVLSQFNSKSDKLLEATGWEKNEESGQWIDNKNNINYEKSSSFWVSHLFQNFKWIQFSSIIKDDQKYYIFLYEKLDGEYEYPNIHENWEPYKTTHFFVMTSIQYEDIKKHLDLKTGENIVAKSNMSGNINDQFKILGGEHLYNEENLLVKINKLIEEPSSYAEECFVLNSQIVDGQEVVRFRLPELCYIALDNMKTGYFEVSFSKFKSIFIE